jgi:hypothetical protein
MRADHTTTRRGGQHAAPRPAGGSPEDARRRVLSPILATRDAT